MNKGLLSKANFITSMSSICIAVLALMPAQALAGKFNQLQFEYALKYLTDPKSLRSWEGWDKDICTVSDYSVKCLVEFDGSVDLGAQDFWTQGAVLAAKQYLDELVEEKGWQVKTLKEWDNDHRHPTLPNYKAYTMTIARSGREIDCNAQRLPTLSGYKKNPVNGSLYPNLTGYSAKLECFLRNS